ncbi:sugar phosphate isomerase/epimerase [Panacibacter sp. DH6]|uniref:Sugar phosphate isomerase/epimerase n=1 Tax=Panacibacter microcysteis TaxID=2793269 RepID=A0A931E5A3_9BACT|nr:TIM barrel protein [Panacibacter microcysteis]MBG9375394.1 sugar phosphate isomerase/epimerase [Panacibacter microcysteis]
MKRKEFLQSGAYAMLMASVARYGFASNTDNMKNDFQLKMLATNWGFEGTLDTYCEKVKKEGYDGIEIWWPTEKKDQEELFATLKKYDLAVGFLTAGHESDYQQHADSFKKMINAAATNNIQRPLYINCHSGKDFFSFEENKALVDYTLALSKDTGIKICHETHRSRMLFAAPVAKHFFEKIPGLRITLDVSHWCNVSESLLQDQPGTMAMALERTDHIHARIGHQEGPQVNDPRAPEWKDAVDAHFAWWDKIVKIKKQKGEILTVLTEFGPPTYLPTVPYTMQPLADQWAINVFMMQTFRKRYS